MTTTVEEAIKELKDKEAALIAEAAAVRQAYIALQVSISPIQPGDVVIYRDGKKYRVAELDIKNIEFGFCFANPRKTNGEWSNAKKRLYGDMTVIEKADA
jgi:hypothetical protein